MRMNKSFLLFFLFLLLPVFLQGQSIRVCKSCSITTLKEGVEKAEDGDTLVLASGIYQEHGIVLIQKSLHIMGEGLPVIDAQYKETVISVKAENITIDGLKIINVGSSYTQDFAGILLSNVNNFRITNNVIEEAFFGILIERSKNGYIANNVVSSSAKEEASAGNGIHLWHSEHIEIENNLLTKMRDGIYLEFANHCTIRNNISMQNLRYGLHFMFSNDNSYQKNVFEHNGAGVAVMFSKRIEMIENTFKRNWGPASYGLLLKEINDASLIGNVFEDNTIGINADGTNRIKFKNNEFISNGYAIKVLGACYDNTFSANNFLFNAFDLAYTGRINGNTFTGNYWSDYTGYDLDQDGVGDIPFRPVRLFSYLVNEVPESIVLLRSLFIDLMDFSERITPVFTPAELLDETPSMTKNTW